MESSIYAGSLGCWDERFIDQVSDVPSIIFFHNLLQNPLIGHKSIRNYEKNNAWKIRRLVDDSFVPATQRIILKIVGF